TTLYARLSSGRWHCVLPPKSARTKKLMNKLIEPAPRRIYVKWYNEIKDALIPTEEITTLAVHRNDLYFCAGSKLYKVCFTPAIINCELVRPLD
ncbi:hypothetical protein PMAYCL1PPCAC_09637, partial [Pristionchus mayeri]